MKTYIVDSFTGVPFKGNPAGVCLVEEPLGDPLMLQIAQELGLSETAFVQPRPAGDYSIRYFSPKMEIPLCGHATLASAKVLFADGAHDQVHFHNIQGLDLFVRREDDRIVMEFPVYATEPAEVPPAMLRALGIGAPKNVAYNRQTRILLLEITDSQVLADLAPDFPALLASHDSIHGVLVTAPSATQDCDFHSRYFWPWSGTDEDPVTGGTHTFLAKYWAERLGRSKLRSFQSSKRTGSMEVELIDDKVLLKGEAFIVLDGNLRV